MNQKKALYEVIQENLRNGELPDSFSLPQDENADPNKVRWADGAYDGVGIFHMSQPEITDAHIQMIGEAFAVADNHEEAAAKMQQFFEKITPLRSIDAIQCYILDHAETLEPEMVFSFALDCLKSDNVNTVKLGLIIVEIFNEPEDAVKDIIRTLGLSDEFTIFTIFNMMKWENGNSEVFSLAKKVHGWGRIHAVERLNPETQEIKDWLLAEGIRNDVVPDYSALDVYRKVDIASLLQSSITDTQLDQIASVLLSMFEEGPVRGISALSTEEAQEMLSHYLDQTAFHTKTLDICALVLVISNDARFEQFSQRCIAILNSYGCKSMIEQELTHGKAINLAKKLHLPYKEKILAHMKSDFEKGYFNCIYLMDDAAYREQLIDVFRQSLPLQNMIGEPTSDNGWGKQNAKYNILTFLLQSLNDYPLCGTDLLIAGIHTPIVPCRFQAIKTALNWCKMKECTLSELSPDVYDAVEYLKAAEVNDRIKEIIKEFGI